MRRFRKSIRTGDFFVRPRQERETMPSVDLHGLRYHVGERRVSDFMAEQIRKGAECVKIIHGHGTGDMRKIAYEWIENHRHLVADTEDVGPAVIIYLR